MSGHCTLVKLCHTPIDKSPCTYKQHKELCNKICHKIFSLFLTAVAICHVHITFLTYPVRIMNYCNQLMKHKALIFCQLMYYIFYIIFIRITSYLLKEHSFASIAYIGMMYHIMEPGLLSIYIKYHIGNKCHFILSIIIVC